MEGGFIIRSGIKINSEEVEKQLVEEYLMGVSSSILMKKYGYKTKKSITDKVKKYKGKNFDFSEISKNRKKYHLNLQVIKNPFDAYFLGLMITDGYVVSDKKFGMDLIDEDCIQFISNITGQSYSTYLSNDEFRQTKYRIVFSDKEIVNQLKRYNIIQNKTHQLKGFDFLLEEERFIPYFIRGVIDGDGHIGYTSYGSLCFSIAASSKSFLDWLNIIFINKMFMYDLQTPYQNKKTGVWSIGSALQRNINILKILSYDRPFGMMRKHNQIHEQASETIMETSYGDDGIVQTATN